MRCPQHPVPLAGVAELTEVLKDLFVRGSPCRGILERASVFLEDHPGVIPTDLTEHDIRDVATATARPRDGIDEGQCFLRQGDVGADEAHGATPCELNAHTVAHTGNRPAR